MAVEPNGDLYITGSLYGSNSNAFAFFKYDQDGNLELSKRYDSDNLNDDGFDVIVDSNEVFITGFSETINGTRMTSIKYSLSEKDMSLHLDDSTGYPIYTDRDLIIRVDTSLIKQDQIDKLENQYWSLSEIFDSTFVVTLEKTLKSECNDNHCQIKVYRIFKHQKTTDTISISRSGDTVRIPNFWATFLFEFPSAVDLTNASDTLVDLFS